MNKQTAIIARLLYGSYGNHRSNVDARRRRQRSSNIMSLVAAEVSRLEDRCLMATGILGTESLINDTIGGNQQFSNDSDRSFAVDMHGNSIVVWSSPNTAGHGTQIVARRVDNQGQPLGDEFVVSTTSAGVKGNAVVSAAGDKFVIAWEAQGNAEDPHGWGIFARVYSIFGEELTDEILVNGSIAGHQQDPSIDWVGYDRFVVGWTNSGHGQPQTVFARIFDDTGAPVTRQMRLSSFPHGGQRHVVVTSLPDGGFQAAWSGRGLRDAHGIFSRRFDDLGRALGAEFKVNTAAHATELQPTITHSADQVLIAWQSSGSPQDRSGSGVFARLYGLDGTPAGPEFRLNEMVNGTQADPSVTFLNDGSFVAAWEGAGVGETSGIFVREFAADGTPLASERMVNTTVAGVQANPTVQAHGPSGYLLAWAGNVGGGAAGGLSAASEITTMETVADTQGIAMQSYGDAYLVDFAGYKWFTNFHWTKDNGAYSNGQLWDPNNVYIGNDGYMHLKITQKNDGPYSAEAVLVKKSSGEDFVPGYGTYLVAASTSESFERLSRNNTVTFGAFTYEDLRGVGKVSRSDNSITGLPQELYDSLQPGMPVAGNWDRYPFFQPGTVIDRKENGKIYVNKTPTKEGEGEHTIFFTAVKTADGQRNLINGHRELDMIEASRFANQYPSETNAQFALQPWSAMNENVNRFTLANDQPDITLVMKWVGEGQPVVFSVYYGIFGLDDLAQHSPAYSWTTSAAQNQFIPDTFFQRMHLNLYREPHEGSPTSLPEEVIVKKFEYRP